MTYRKFNVRFTIQFTIHDSGFRLSNFSTAITATAQLLSAIGGGSRKMACASRKAVTVTSHE